MRKRLEDMTIAEVEELLRPGTLVAGGDDWLSRRWQCGSCERVFETDIPGANPAPCNCGSTIMLILPDAPH